ncbi:MAG: hypothetical protein M3040_06040 [Bacteroidota bacterium]|nr:hypothetical protein [Bacteroidota bacterium]
MKSLQGYLKGVKKALEPKTNNTTAAGNEIAIVYPKAAMKKILVLTSLVTVLVSCGGTGSTDNTKTENDTANKAGLTNPSAIDTTKHPDGVTNSSVISTDTAAMNMQNSVNKAKQDKKH